MHKLQLEDVLDYVARGELDTDIRGMIEAASNGNELLRQARILHKALRDIGDDIRPDGDVDSASPLDSLSVRRRSIRPIRGDFKAAPSRSFDARSRSVLDVGSVRERYSGVKGIQRYARRSMRESSDLGVLRIHHGQLLHSPPLRVLARSAAPPSLRKRKSESKLDFLRQPSKKKEPYWKRIPDRTAEEFGNQLSISFEMQLAGQPMLSFSVLEFPSGAPASGLNVTYVPKKGALQTTVTDPKGYAQLPVPECSGILRFERQPPHQLRIDVKK